MYFCFFVFDHRNGGLPVLIHFGSFFSSFLMKRCACLLRVREKKLFCFYMSLGYSCTTLSGHVYLFICSFFSWRQIDGDGATCFLSSCTASETACCCADQQLPDQIRAAWDCIIWCHFKIQKRFKIHFSHLSNIYEEHRSML